MIDKKDLEKLCVDKEALKQFEKELDKCIIKNFNGKESKFHDGRISSHDSVPEYQREIVFDKYRENGWTINVLFNSNGPLRYSFIPKKG